MWIYDEFLGQFYYDELDTPAGTNYSQTGNVTLALVPNSTQLALGSYLQNVDVTLGIYSDTTQSLSLPVGPQAYTQQGNQLVVFIGDAPQSHTPAFAGQDGQSGDVVLLLQIDAYQEHRGGGNPGDVVQTSGMVVTFSGDATHLYTPPELVRIGQATIPEVAAFGFGTATIATVSLQAGVLPVGRVILTVATADEDFNEPVGPAGGVPFIELALGDAPAVPIASINAAAPSVELYPWHGDLFTAVVAAVNAGSVPVRMLGYESVPGRAIPRAFGQATVSVEAAP